MNDPKLSVSKKDEWLRAAIMLLFLIICELGKVILGLVALAQFIFVLLTGSANENLQRFGKSMGIYLQQVIEFLSYNQEEKPFPFAPWPEAGELDETVRCRELGEDEPSMDEGQPL